MVRGLRVFIGPTRQWDKFWNAPTCYGSTARCTRRFHEWLYKLGGRASSDSPVLAASATAATALGAPAAMSAPKLDRTPSIRDRVEDTLHAHRNELVALLSK